ncbi:hypothetical protein N9100_01940 [Gammaproteobacteria bacterium]|nr:hypothetical protein [Gammaproteobacteria bacterium]
MEPSVYKDEGFISLAAKKQSGRLPVQHLLKEIDRIARQDLEED